MKQATLSPSDIVVACQLAITPSAIFKDLSASIGLSVGECHNAVRRLRLSSLLNPITRSPATDILIGFITTGVPIAFPAQLGPPALGVPTALAAPVFATGGSADEVYVWPDIDGTQTGTALTPLFPNAAALARSNTPLYDLLAVTDALRLGQIRERRVAEDLLRELLRPGMR